MAKHASTKTTYAGGVNMGSQPKAGTGLSDYATGRVQPFAGDNSHNLQPQQFSHSSGTVKTGYNPLTYDGGAHRKWRS